LESALEGFDGVRYAFDLDLDLATGVPHGTAEFELVGETPDERPKADALHHSANDDRARDLRAGLRTAHRPTSAAVRAGDSVRAADPRPR
jgi:hypothetical protein